VRKFLRAAVAESEKTSQIQRQKQTLRHVVLGAAHNRLAVRAGIAYKRAAFE